MTFDASKIRYRTSVHHVELHECLASTSDLAGNLVEDLIRLSPALVLTPQQTGGRGRGHNSWWAETGALTFTLVLRASDLALPPERQAMISLAAGCAVRRVLSRHLTGPVLIKWPNDLLVGRQKISGILTEQRSVPSDAAILIGIGINVNNSLSAAPLEVRRLATSLFDQTGTSVCLNDLLIDILNAIDADTARLESEPDDLLAELNSYHALQGQLIELETGGSSSTGICEGVSSSGELQLRMDTGIVNFRSGSVVRW